MDLADLSLAELWSLAHAAPGLTYGATPPGIYAA